MTAAGEDGERLVTEQARMVAIGRVAAALSSPDPERPGVVAWVSHSGLARIAELAADTALAAVAPDIAAEVERRVLDRCVAELQAERDRPVLNPLRIDALIDRWSGRAPADEEGRR